MQRRAALILVPVAALLLPTIAAAAADFKTFPGASCQVEANISYGNGLPSQWYLWGGAYSNTNSTDLLTGYDHVVCPIMRDRTINTNGTQHVLVSIYNSGNGRGFSCDLWSLDKFAGSNLATNGFPFALETFTASVPTTTTGFVDLALDLSLSTVGGYYALHCEVPPGGYIYRYEVGEFSDTAQR